MDENIGRPALIEMLKLQIEMIKEYQNLLKSPEFRDARENLRKAIQTAIVAVGPILAFGHATARKLVDLHKDDAMAATLRLLEKLLEQEQERDERSQRMKRRERVSGQRS
jgi:hypothetical protein